MYDINISKQTAVVFKSRGQGFYREIIPNCSYIAGIDICLYEKIKEVYLWSSSHFREKHFYPNQSE